MVRSLFDACVAAANPYARTRDALIDRLAARDDDGRAWIIALGKASAHMARAAVDAAHETGLELAGGLVVSNAPVDVDPPLEAVVGDHPIPGAQSLHAATRLGALVHAVLPSDHVLLLISGGTTSLVAAPADDVADANDASPAALFRALLGAGGGVDIHVMNAVRRRFLRWGGGRLAAALAPAHVHQVLLSDVIGDDPAVIASGPAVPDPLTAADVLALIAEHRLAEHIAPSLVAHLQRAAGAAADAGKSGAARGAPGETPKPGSAAFEHVDAPVVIGRAAMHDGAAAFAHEHGITLTMHETPLSGDARARGDELARWLATDAGPGVHLWSGETTVSLGANPGLGGRSQELALSAALALETIGAARAVTLLAAGTDGRDGPTDAAGAIVDHSTAAQIRGAGIDPQAALAAHNAFPALDAAGALVVTGPTGTNVADVVIATVYPTETALAASVPRP